MMKNIVAIVKKTYKFNHCCICKTIFRSVEGEYYCDICHRIYKSLLCNFYYDIVRYHTKSVSIW